MINVRCLGIGFVAGLALAALIAGALYWRDAVQPTPSVPAPLAPELRRAETATAPTAPLRYFPGAKEKLSLAGAIADPKQIVTAATKLDISDRPRTVSAVTDTGTGITSLYVREDPLPWLRRQSVLEVGLHYGVRDDGEAVYRASARYDVLQIKGAHIGVAGSVEEDRSFVGVGVSLRFR